MTQHWTFLLLMNGELHAEMRVFQLVNNQQTPMVTFSGRRSGELLTMTFLVEADERVARRIEALLYRLQSILRVDCFSMSAVTHDRSGVPREEGHTDSRVAPGDLDEFHEGAD